MLMSPETSVYVDPQDAEKNKVQGIIAYIPPLFLIPLFAAPDSKFAKYHANQGLLVTIVSVILWFVQWLLVSLIIGANPFSAVFGIGRFFITIIRIITWGIPTVLALIGIIGANKGECKPLPFIGNFHLLDK